MSGISLADPDDEEKLIRALAQHLHFRQEKITVVFDKAAGADEGPRFETKRLQVIFAPQGKTADEIIIDIIKKDPNPKGLIVVSSDNEIRRCARSRRARIVSAEEYARKLESPVPRHRSEEGADMGEVDVEDWLQYFRRRRR
jgi:predicted RNA-binding protein with PIN domain